MLNLFSRNASKPIAVNRVKAWRTPSFTYYNLYRQLADAPHLLIAGATGSGKSVTMEGIITTIITNSPARARLTLIDTKKVSLWRFSGLPHVIEYADEVPAAWATLQHAAERMDARFQAMRRQGVTEYQGADEYIIVDELADLVLNATFKKKIVALLQRISMLGRAAKVHLVIGTQNVTREVVSSPIKSNLDVRICLRTASAQDSRNVCGVSGAEQFPSPIQTGKALALIRNGADIEKWILPRYTDQQINDIISWWTSRACVA